MAILEKAAVRRAAMPITVEQYQALGRAGLISERTELVDGVIVEKMTQSPLHAWLADTLLDFFREAVGDRVYVRSEKPLTLVGSEPEPDIAVVAGNRDDYREVHPKTAKLVIEVAVSSLELDREKAAIYAAAEIPEYWIVLPETKTVEVYARPVGGRYTNVSSRGVGEELRPEFDTAITIRIDDLFTT